MAILDSPILLFCSERSGSNLITKIFDAHSLVCAPSPAHLFNIMSDVADRYPSGTDELRNALITLFRAKVSSWTIDAYSDTRLGKLLSPLQSPGAMAAALYRAEMESLSKTNILIKENSAFGYLSMIRDQSVTLQIIFMVRDPRDMALSWKTGPVMRGGVVRAARRWRHDQEGYLRSIAQLPDNIRVSFLRYEDLLNTPSQELCRVCSEMKLPFEENMLDFSSVSSSAHANAFRSSMWRNLNRGILTENAGKYASKLDANDVAYIEAITNPYMNAMGYQTVTPTDAPFGHFSNFVDLEAHLLEREPYDKHSYTKLSKSERDRFENWSQLTAKMRGRPLILPKHFIASQSSI